MTLTWILGLLLWSLAAEAAAPAVSNTNEPSPARPPLEDEGARGLKLQFEFNSATNDAADLSGLGLAPTNNALLAVAASPAGSRADGTNVIGEAAEQEQARLRLFQSKLELGRQQRLAKDFEQSEKVLKGLLESTAPMEAKRPALLEMALLAQDTKHYLRAQQIYSQFVHLFHDDPCIPELLLRQGVLYRDMGAPVLALSKFYAVMSSALSLKLERLDYYQRLVLQAQTEVAETYYLQGQFAEATDFFNRLLKLDNPQLNQPQIHYKLIRAYSASAHYAETAAQSEIFIARYPKAEQLPEIRFLLADALKRLGRKREAMQQVLALLQVPQESGTTDETRLYWQQRAGNEIANQLYQEGDCLNSLEIYQRLGELNPSPSWRLPAWYQVGLIYERLKQPEKASETYTKIIESQSALGTNAPAGSLATVLEMAKWRKQRLAWQVQAELANQRINSGAGTRLDSAAGDGAALRTPGSGGTDRDSVPPGPAAGGPKEEPPPAKP